MYSAREEPSGLERVVKQLRPGTPQVLEAFRAEFALLSRLSHPRLVRVVEFGTALIRGEAIHHYVAERLPGLTLADLARKGASSRELITPLLDAVSALSAIHELGMRHGDFTPTNVMVGEDGRGTLIDVGCAEPFGAITTLSGTDQFIAPELLNAAVGDARADLYAVGRSLARVFELLRREPPPEVARIIERLTRADPNKRPQTAEEVLEAFKRRQNRQFSWAAKRLLGREPQLAAFGRWLEELQHSARAPRVFGVKGSARSGLTRLVRELSWRAQLQTQVLRAMPSEPESLGTMLALAAGMSRPVRSLSDLFSALARLRGSSPPVLLVVEDHERASADQQQLLGALLRSLADDAGISVLVAGRALPAEVTARIVECTPLSLQDLKAWVPELVPERQLPELLSKTAGLPGAIESALRELHTATVGPSASERPPPSAGPLPALAERLAVPERARRALAKLFVLGGEHEVSEPLLDWQAIEPLIERSLAERDGASARLLPSGSALSSAQLGSKELTRAHLDVAEWLAGATATPGAVAQQIAHLTKGAALARAEAVFQEQRELLEQFAGLVGQHLWDLLEVTQNADVLLALGGLALKAGQPRWALRAASRASRAAQVPLAQALPLAADALIRLGHPARAERLLTRHLERTPNTASITLEDRVGRSRLARGDYAGAKRAAERALALGGAPEALALANEVLGVACTYLGDLESAGRALEIAAAWLAQAGTPRDRCRIQSHAATAAFRAGNVSVALLSYGAALELAEAHDLSDLIATSLLNLGTAEQQAGLWGGALRHYERGAAFARALGRSDTELILGYNMANLYAEIGAAERATETILQLEPRASALKLGQLELGLALLSAELDLLAGRVDQAETRLTATKATLERGGSRESLELGLRFVDVDLARRHFPEAEQRLVQLEAAFGVDSSGELSLLRELARARVEAGLGKHSALTRLERARDRARGSGLVATEAVLATALFEASETLASVDEALVQRERARRSWDRVAADLPSALGQFFWSHPRRSRLSELSRPAAAMPDAPRAADALAYRRLLALNRRLSSPHALPRVLDYAVQAAVDLSGAERGFLLLASTQNGEDAIDVVSSSEPFTADRGPSQSIARRTLQREEAVLSTDALDDPRFSGQRSVHAMQLKSVLCVPILSPEGTLGALYVDSSIQRNQFSTAERDLLQAFADQVAIAIANARLRERLEAQTEELAHKNLQLEQTAKGQALEVEKLREEVRQHREGLTLRYDYAQIVGRGEAMRRVLERVDKLVSSEANVLILGESGTGKELIARAMHWNGPRKNGPFVGINCAALPENLLESELFGHVRGAFTGADRDKPGLMQAASGGTLFLDEIGELPAAVQVKLLRALQEREVRPLGALAAVPLDIRLLAATHRDLGERVQSGAFREDLFYRVAVVTVELPPLRERLEDLPELSKQILEKLAKDGGTKLPSLAPDAIRKLSAHPFRGNVRELQNILTRAFVLTQGARIRAEDIELEAARPKRYEPPTTPGATRKAFETDERLKILTALQRTRWNVSAVSAALAIPRATLHRKLKRYGIERQR